MTSTVQRLENDNYSLLKTKEDLEHKLTTKQGEIRNVQYELKHHRDETNKREIQLQDAISKNESELYKDKEMYKNLNNHHTALKKQLEQLQRERDENEVLIRQLRDKEYALQEKLKNVQEDLSRSDGTNIKTELRNHVENRRRHLDEVKSILNNLSVNLQKVNANEEYRIKDSDFNYYQNRVDDLEGEIKHKEVRLNDLNNENYSLKVEADCNKKNRADYEVSHRNYLDLKEQHDKLHNDNYKIRNENQHLEREIRNKRAEAHEIRESIHGGDDYTYKTSADRFGSGNKKEWWL